MSETRPPTKVIVALGLLATLGSAQAFAQADCAKCEITMERMVGSRVNQQVCPGQNAVVCDYSYIKNTDSKCTVGFPNLRDCRPVVREKVYVAKKYAPGTCGVRRADRSIGGCGLPGGAAVNKKRDSSECAGESWDNITMVSASQAFSLALRTPDGPRFLTGDGVTALGRSVIAIPAALLQRADANLAVRNDEFFLDLWIQPRAPTRFVLPNQEFVPTLLQGGARLLQSRVEEGRVHLSLAVARPNLGAVREYAVDIAGLKVKAGALPELREAPSSQGSSTLPIDDDALLLLAELSSAGKVLTSGAGVVARRAAAEETAVAIWSLAAVAALTALGLLALLLRRSIGSIRR